LASALSVELGGNTLCLLGGRAVLLPQTRSLLIADAHLGKAQSFRRLGVPVPAGTTADNLARLDALIAQTCPREIVFLGDLLHAPQAKSAAAVQAIEAWRARHAGLAMQLVLGNHDQRAGGPPPSWKLQVVDEPYRVGPWALCHHPQEVSGAYVLAGHVHPCASIGTAIDRLRLPCFHLGPTVGVLPAFGSFTGMHAVRRVAGDIVVLVCEGQLRRLPPPAAPSAVAGPKAPR
jgi:DNA ligase-associated metallophosphoesterase